MSWRISTESRGIIGMLTIFISLVLVAPSMGVSASAATTHPAASNLTSGKKANSTVTVTFDANGGTGTMAPQTEPNGTVAALEANAFTRSGYIFTGWMEDYGYGTAYADGAQYRFWMDVTFSAQWQPLTVTVTYDANGGTGTMAPQTEPYGNATALTANSFTRSGYVYAGWGTSPGTTSYSDGVTYGFTSSVTLYAQWNSTAATVQFDCNGGTGSIPSVTGLIGQTIYLAAGACTLAGYAFVGWSMQSDGYATGSLRLAGAPFVLDFSRTFYAMYTPVITGTPPGGFTVTFNTEGGDPIAPITAVTVVSLPADTFSDHTFNGWFTAPVGGTQVTTASGYTTVYAQWTLALPAGAPGSATILLSAGSLVGSYIVTLYTPAGNYQPVGSFTPGTITITDSSATPGSCSSSQWNYYGPDGAGGYLYGASCTITSVEAAGVAVQATYSGVDFSAPASNVLTVGGAQSVGVPPTSVTVSVGVASTLTASANGATASIAIPAGALPPGTTVSTYPIANAQGLSAQVPTGQTYVVALGVSWLTTSGTSPSATSPITMTISDPSIVAGDSIYVQTSSGLTLVKAATTNGSVTVTFVDDPVFLVTSQKTISQSRLSITTTTGHVGKGLTLVTSGGSGTGMISYTVTDGTASQCAFKGHTLYAASPGTCMVTATRAGDATYGAVSSVPTKVTLSLPKRPAALTISFSTVGSRLSVSAKKSLLALSGKLFRGASVTITGYAMGNSALGNQRAAIVAAYLKNEVTLHITIKTAGGRNNAVTITTTRQ